MEKFSGRRLADARRRSGQPIESVALKVGRGAEQIRRYERETSDPSASMLVQLADAVGVTAADLFETVVDEVAA